MAIKNSVSNEFLSTFLDSIGVFDWGLPGVWFIVLFISVHTCADWFPAADKAAAKLALD